MMMMRHSPTRDMRGATDDDAGATTTSFVRRGRRFRDAQSTPTTKTTSNVDSSIEKVHRQEVAVTTTRSGARGGLYGRILASSGSADVDALTGGGLPLGSATCAGTDGCTTRGETLFGRYFLAEGVARGHRLCWVRASSGRRRRRLLDGHDDDVDDLRAFIPKRVEGKTTGGDDDDDEGEDAEDARKADDGLRIAWQYRRYLKEGRALDDSRVGTSQFIRGGNSGDGGSEATGAAKKTRKKSLRAPDMCALYDLTREEDASRLEGVDLTTARLWNDDDDVTANSWSKCYAIVRDFIRETNAKGDATIGRILVQPETPTDDAEWAECASLVNALKSLVYGTNVVLVFVLPLIDAPERVGALIRHSVDCAIDVQPLEGPTSEIESLLPEPQTCVGLVAVRKLQFQGAVVSPLSRMDRVYALQVRRKRMAIKPLQIRPEEEATKKDTKSACGTASAAGLDDF